MAEILGSAAVVSWVYATGTISMNADFRTWSYNPTVELVDSTAGADATRQRIVSFKDGSGRMTMLFQSAMSSADYTGLVEGQLGTITYSPAGTATAATLKLTIPAISQGVSFTQPYDDVTSLEWAWQQNGVRVVGTN